jgi:ABC-2 type transport system permease protein
MTPVLGRTLRDERRPMIGWAIGIAALGLVTTGSWPAMAGSTDELGAVLENLPPAMSAFFGDGFTSFSAAAVIGSRLFGTIGLALFIGFAISRGADAIAGEEADGTLELLVTQPLSRAAIAVDKVIAAWLALAGLVVLQQVLLLGMLPAVGLSFAPSRVMGASLGLYLLALLFGMLAFAVGAATGNRRAAVAVSASLAAGAFLLAGLGSLVPAFETAAAYSPFARFDGTVVLEQGLDVVAAAWHAGMAVLLTALGIVAFDRRDLT